MAFTKKNTITNDGKGNLIFQDIKGSEITININNNEDFRGFLESHKPTLKDTTLFLRITQNEKAVHYKAKLEIKSPELNGTLTEDLELNLDQNLFNRLSDLESLKTRTPNTRRLAPDFSPEKILEVESELEASIYENFLVGEIRTCFENFFLLLCKKKIEKLTLAVSSDIPAILNIPFECMRNKDEAEAYTLKNDAFKIIHTIEPNLTNYEITAIKPLAPPLKILFITSLPVDLDENARYLELEKEQELLIQATAGLIADKKLIVDFLDIADPESIETALQKGEHHIVHISGHGSHGKEHGVLYLETETGDTLKVSGDELGSILSRCQSFKLVVLSACETARAENQGVAGALIHKGIPAVLAMRYPVTDITATNFTSTFYEQLCHGRSLRKALFEARFDAYKIDRERRKENQILPMEWSTPFLYLNQGIESFIDLNKPINAASYYFEKPKNFVEIKGGELKKVGSGFIGRHKKIIELNRMFKSGKKAVGIYGLGGLGKTTLAIRFADNYKQGTFKIIQFIGVLDESSIINTIVKQLDINNKQTTQILNSPDHLAIHKLQHLFDNYCKEKNLIFLFDNFEDNQDLDKLKDNHAEITSDSLKQFLEYFWWKLPDNNFALLTTRYPFTRPVKISFLPINNMNFPDSFKLMNRYETILPLSGKDKRKIYKKFGGHPRAYEWLDQLLSDGSHSWKDLDQLFNTMNQKSNQDLLLDQLLGKLTEKELTVLQTASVFRTITPIAFLNKFEDLPSQQISSILKKLENLSLIELNEEYFFVHRLTVNRVLSEKYISHNKLLNLHYTTGDILTDLDKEERLDVMTELLEARWHFIQAQQFDKAVDVSFEFDDLAERGYSDFVLGLYLEVVLLKISQNKKATLFHQIGIIHQYKGEYDQALEFFQKSLKIKEQIGNPSGIANSYHHIGIIHQYKGEYDQALEFFQKSLKIKEQIGNPSGIANSYHHIGIIHQYKGEYDQALEFFQKSLKIKEQIGNPSGIANSYHHIGIIHQYKGEYDQALEFFQKSLKIKEQIGNPSGIANSYHHIGIIHQYKGEYDQALEFFQKSLSIEEQIGNPSGIANSLAQMGLIYKTKGEPENALKHLLYAFSIFSQLGIPQAELARDYILQIKEEMPESEFERIFKKLTQQKSEE